VAGISSGPFCVMFEKLEHVSKIPTSGFWRQNRPDAAATSLGRTARQVPDRRGAG
jgi:hypothetical protein